MRKSWFLLSCLSVLTLFMSIFIGCTKNFNQPAGAFGVSGPTATNTPTITLTAGNTSTSTSTCTPTSTPPTATPTPNAYTDFDDFWSTNIWPGYGLTGSGLGGTASTSTINTGVDTAHYWNFNPVPESNPTPTYMPQSGSITLTGGFGTGIGGSQGYFDFYIFSVWPNGNINISGNPVPLLSVGTTNDLEMQLYCPAGGPMTIQFVQMLGSGQADVGQTPNINFPIPNDGQWHDCVVPLSSLTFTTGNLTHLETTGVTEIQYQVLGPATTTTCVLDLGSVVFY